LGASLLHSENNNRVVSDSYPAFPPKVMCGSSSQVLFMAIGTLFYLPIAAGIHVVALFIFFQCTTAFPSQPTLSSHSPPVFVYKLLKQVRRSAITDTQRRHESFLRSQEDQFSMFLLASAEASDASPASPFSQANLFQCATDNNVSDSWLIKRLYLITPLRRRGIYHWVWPPEQAHIKR
jgi:hypothetical protein